MSVLYRIEKGYKESENKKEARAGFFLILIRFPKVTVLDGERRKKGEEMSDICETLDIGKRGKRKCNKNLIFM